MQPSPLYIFKNCLRQSKVTLVLILIICSTLIWINPAQSSPLKNYFAQNSEANETLLPPDLSSAGLDLKSDIPIDIPFNLEQEKNLLSTNFPLLQEWFDKYSWDEFVALNWPLSSDGKPLPKITDEGIPRWLDWHESLQVFRPDGDDPKDDSPRHCPSNTSGMRELYTTSSVFSNAFDLDIAEEVNQAFTSPLYDQNGKEVRYEIFLNDEEYDYIVENKIYNIEGQIEYSQANHGPLSFPSGNPETGEIGAIEIKLAWKQLDSDRDSPSRFYTEEVLLPALDSTGEPMLDDNGNFKSCSEETVGLVGMHISHKTNSSPQWVWSTFEQVDNLNVDSTEVSADGKSLYALFHDYSPAGQILPVNVPPRADENGVKRTQVSREIPIPGLAQRVSEAYQRELADAGSPLQYYHLVDTQWPTAPYPDFQQYAAVPGSPSPTSLPESILNKSVGAPAPVYLTNSTMETYLQFGDTTAHFQENGFPFDFTPVFGTESCMGCHFSAGIATGFEMTNVTGKLQKSAIYGGDVTADFSWLPQLKANWKEKQ